MEEPRQSRRALFAEVFESDALMRTRAGAWMPQRPYETTGWPTKRDLDARVKEKLDSGMQAHAFTSRYFVGERLAIQSGVTGAALYALAARPPLDALMTRALFDRDDLVLKVTPLDPRLGRGYLSDCALAEVYNELRIAYFLRELVHAYSAVPLTPLLDRLRLVRRARSRTLPAPDTRPCTLPGRGGGATRRDAE